MVLYRASSVIMKPLGFWTPDKDYVKYIHPERKIYWSSLNSNARIVRFQSQATRDKIAKARKQKYQVAVFPAWDWDTDEYVILDLSVLSAPVELGR